MNIVVRLKRKGITAENQLHAIERAEMFFHEENMASIFDHDHGNWESEYADDVEGFLVDERGDEEYEKSRWYCSDGTTEATGRCMSCGRATASADMPKSADASTAEKYTIVYQAREGDGRYHTFVTRYWQVVTKDIEGFVGDFCNGEVIMVFKGFCDQVPVEFNHG